MISFGYLLIGGNKYYVEPENYSITVDGETTNFVGTSKGLILDLGYARLGFQAQILNQDAMKIVALETLAKSAIASQTPIEVVDTVYPGGRNWSGFFKLPIQGAGAVKYTGTAQLPEYVSTSPVTINFFNAEMELL
jgi:hypothetical protein